MTRTDDPLLQCLLALCRYHGNASTAEAVMGGLPVDTDLQVNLLTAELTVNQ